MAAEGFEAAVASAAVASMGEGMEAASMEVMGEGSVAADTVAPAAFREEPVCLDGGSIRTRSCLVHPDHSIVVPGHSIAVAKGLTEAVPAFTKATPDSTGRMWCILPV